MNKETFGSVCKEFPSSEALYFCLDKVKKRALSDSDEDKLWMGLTVLWERWFPDIPNFEMLDDKMQQGYDLLVQQKPIEACNVWWDVWEDILYLMDNHNIPDIKKFDEKFRGTQSVTNWSSDFELEMEHASIKDVSFAQKRIDFCTEYIKRYNDPDGLNIKNMKSAIAESYYVLGKIEEGDKLFEQYLKEDPKWGWGWIGWADQYWFWENRETNDYNKAINILKQGLKVDNLEDRLNVLERLMDIYNELEMYEEAKQISDEIVKTKESQNEATIFSRFFQGKA